MKTDKIINLLFLWILLLVTYHSKSQNNTFYGTNALNSCGGGCVENSAFGSHALYNTTGSYNTGIGYSVLYNNVTGASNTAVGNIAMFYNTTGVDNVAVGYAAVTKNQSGNQNTGIGEYSLANNSTGSFNSALGFSSLRGGVGADISYCTSVGVFALYSNKADSNTAVGYQTLYKNTTGRPNTGIGAESLYNNSTGNYNVGVGYRALYSNTTAGYGTAVGYESLYSNTTANGPNDAFGYQALYSNTTGYHNVAVGRNSLYSNVSALYNTAVGSQSLYSNTTGQYNTGIGTGAGSTNSTGQFNTSVGFNALATSTVSNNAAMGANALRYVTTGSCNTGLGFNAGISVVTGGGNTLLGCSADVSSSSLSNATAIGQGTIVNASNKVRIGNASVTVVEGPVAYTVSDGRFKKNVEESVVGLEFIKLLRPVVYNFDAEAFDSFLSKNGADDTTDGKCVHDFSSAFRIRQSGFIAQEVEKAAMKVKYNFNGIHVPENDKDNYSISYQQFVVPLVKGMQEQQDLIDKQQEAIIAALDKIEALSSELQNIKECCNSKNTGNIYPNQDDQPQLFKVVPNPSYSSATIYYYVPESVISAKIELKNVNGITYKSVAIPSFGSSSLNIETSNLVSGIYYYSLVVNGILIDTQKLSVVSK